MADGGETPGPAGAPAAWVALWQQWWEAAGLRAPLSGDVGQVIDAALIRTVGDQLGFLNINASRTGDADLERRITEEVASYGRQLGKVLDALDVLIRMDSRGPLTDADSRALGELSGLRSEIEMMKLTASAERVDRLVADIEALRRDGTETAVLDRLRRAVDGSEPG
jgi:hypothetical protein